MKTRSIRDTTFRKEEKEVEQMEFKKKILVIGSLNMDLVVETPHMPKAGETITGKSITNVLGGKGANQAYAAGKLGGNVGMIGAVGNDACGRALNACMWIRLGSKFSKTRCLDRHSSLWMTTEKMQSSLLQGQTAWSQRR